MKTENNFALIFTLVITGLVGCVFGEDATINGQIWTYSISNGGATITAVSGAFDKVIIPSSLGGYPVTRCEQSLFWDNKNVTSVVIPEGVTYIGGDFFWGCTSLNKVQLPNTLQEIDWHAFYNCSSLREIVIPLNVQYFQRRYNFHPVFDGCPAAVCFHGLPPEGIENTGITIFKCKRQYLAQWLAQLSVSKFGGFYSAAAGDRVNIISSTIRENDPTVMDVEFIVTSRKSATKVRVLAFENYEKSFSNVVRPETFVKDVDGNETAQNIGDNIEANVPHKLSWKVSSDWATRLAKVKLEILVCEDDLLPLELRTIPASNQYGKMKISWNAISESQVFDALLWLYADKDPGLTLAGGLLKDTAGRILVDGTTIKTQTGNIYLGYPSYTYEYQRSAPEYIYSKMGYSVLSGAVLNYANSETRLGLSPSGVRQYAYKIVQE